METIELFLANEIVDRNLVYEGDGKMEKYYSLIEFIKAEYLSQSMCTIWEDISEVIKKDIESNFDIKILQMNFQKYSQLKIYDIKSRKDGKEWKIALVPVAVLYGTNMENIRKMLLEEHSIRGIFTLKNAFFRHSTIPTAALVLGKSDHVWLTSAISNDDVIAIMSDIASYSRKVYYTEQLDVKNFMPEYYNGEMNEINTQLDKYETKKLQEIAEIINGKNVKNEHLADKGIAYLRGRNLQNGKIVDVNDFVRADVAGEYAKQLLEEGDILLQKQFGYHKMVRVTADDLPAIASSSLFIIRAFGVPESYLYQYVTSETGKTIFNKQLSSIERGAVIRSIALKDLKELRVPIFDEQTMMNFANVDSISINDLMPAIKKLTVTSDESTNVSSGAMLERKVYNDFIKAGWNEAEVFNDQIAYMINISTTERWRPDIVLTDKEKLLAVVEVKTSFARINARWVERMYRIVKGGEAPFLILATGAYYEIHSVNDAVVKKMVTPPTKELLLSLLKGKEVH